MRSSRTPASTAAASAILEEARHVVDDVVVARIVLHRPRVVAEHVHQAQADAGVGHDPGHVRVVAQRRDVVDERGARRRRAARATAALRVSIEIVTPSRDSSSTTPSTRRSSSAGVDRLGSGPGRLAADVDDRRTGRELLETARDRDARVAGIAAVRERVRRDVDDADDRRPREALLDARDARHGASLAGADPGAARPSRDPARQAC